MARVCTATFECLVLARDPREARWLGLHGMSFDLRHDGPGTRLPVEPHQRIQPRHLGTFHLAPAPCATRRHEDERLRRLPPATQRRGGLPRLPRVKEKHEGHTTGSAGMERGSGGGSAGDAGALEVAGRYLHLEPELAVDSAAGAWSG